MSTRFDGSTAEGGLYRPLDCHCWTLEPLFHI